MLWQIMASVILLAFLVMLESFIGIEMVNSPPTKKWHKWFWRISFFAIGFCTIIIYCQQYKGEEEKSKQTYDNFANVLSNEAAIRQTVDESKTNIQMTVGFPRFEVKINDSTSPITNGAIVSLPMDRTINLLILNTGEVTAENVSIDFLTILNPTNVLYTGWDLQASSINFATMKTISNFTHWRVVSDRSVAIGNFFSAPPIKFSTNITSLSCSVAVLKKVFVSPGLENLPDDLIIPFVPVQIEVYSDRSKKRDLFFYLKF
jgi:hypothetical protein